MSFKPLMFDEQGLMTESGEEAFCRIAARKLRERGCPESELQLSIQRLLAKPIDLNLEDPINL